MLVLWDKGFDSNAFLAAVTDTGAQILGRLRSNRRTPVLTLLVDGSYLSVIGTVKVRVIDAQIAETCADGTSFTARNSRHGRDQGQDVLPRRVLPPHLRPQRRQASPRRRHAQTRHRHLACPARKAPYRDLGAEYFTKRDPERAMRRMTKEANSLGLTVRFEPITVG